MIRTDLMSLTPDDLAAIVNRGTVKRALRDLDEDGLDAEWDESDAAIVATWPDDATCRLPADVLLADASCSCPANSTCRHLLRTVLAYQRRHAAEAAEEPVSDALPEKQEESERTEPTIITAWNPGDFSDDMLATHFSKQALTNARKHVDAGMLVEIFGGAKPRVRLLDLPHTVTFMVAHDLRYTRCDCDAKAPCIHAAMAVWACRLLPAGQQAARLYTREAPAAALTQQLEEYEALATQVLDQGVAHLDDSWDTRASRRSRMDAEQTLPSLDQALEDIGQQRDLQRQGSAQFSPERVVELTGEVLMRLDLLRYSSDPLTRVDVGGMAAQRAIVYGQTQLVGLGCEVRRSARETELVAYLANPDTGNLHCLRTVSSHPDFVAQAKRHTFLNVPLRRLSGGRIVLSGCKALPDGSLNLTRKKGSVYAQDANWDHFQMPLLFNDFRLLSDYYRGDLPQAVGSRIITQAITVLQPARVTDGGFDYRHHRVHAQLLDAGGQRVELRHPYSGYGSDGTNALLELLTEHADRVCYVAGRVRRDTHGLHILPTAIVYRGATGKRLLQPWVDAALQLDTEQEDSAVDPDEDDSADGSESVPSAIGGAAGAPCIHDLQACLGDLLTTGLTLADGILIDRLGEIAESLPEYGYGAIGSLSSRLYRELDARRHRLQWQPSEARDSLAALLEFLALYPELAQATAPH